MKNNKLTSILILGSSFLFACSGTKKIVETPVSINPLSDTVTARMGTIVYSLPRTVFTITAAFERIIEIPGPYAQFAGDLLGLDNVIREETESWSITEINLNSHQEADPQEIYVIQTEKFFSSNALALRNEGLILDLNPALAGPPVFNQHLKESIAEGFRPVDLGSDEYYVSQSDTAYRRVALDSTFIRIPYIVEKKRRLTDAQLAERAARRLMEIRDGKIMILTGEANVFPQHEASINEINRLEQQYLELFTGKTFKEKRYFTTQVIPSLSQTGKPVDLFRFSELTGPSEAASGKGTPVRILIDPEQKTKKLAVITPEPVEGAVLTADDNLYYRVPDAAGIKILLGNEILLSARRLIYQYGELVRLPGNYLISK